MKKIFVFAAVVVISLMCVNAQNNSAMTSSQKITIQQFMKDYISSVDFIPLETTDGSLLGDVLKVEYADNSYFILHEVGYDKMLARFDANGKFLGSIGTQGRAGNEYLNINDFALSHDSREVYIFDSYARVIVYGYDGKHHKTISIQDPTLKQLCPFLVDSKISKSGDVVLAFAPNHKLGVECCLTTKNFDKAEVLSEGELKMKHGAFINSRNSILVQGDNIYTLRPISTTISVYNKGKRSSVCLDEDIQKDIAKIYKSCDTYEMFYEKHFTRPYLKTIFAMGKYNIATDIRQFYLWNDKGAAIVVDCSDSRVYNYPVSPGVIKWCDDNKIIQVESAVIIQNLSKDEDVNSSLRKQIKLQCKGLKYDSNPVLVCYNLKK